MRNLPLVEVEWVDSATSGGWRSRKSYEELELAPCISAGYLLRKTREKVIIVQTRDDLNSSVCDSMTIPRSAVRKITYLVPKVVGR